MKVKRIIAAYSTIDDKLVKEFDIDKVPVTELKRILNVGKDDVEVYNVYPISNEQLTEFISYVPELLKFELKNIELFAECYQE